MARIDTMPKAINISEWKGEQKGNNCLVASCGRRGEQITKTGRKEKRKKKRFLIQSSDLLSPEKCALPPYNNKKIYRKMHTCIYTTDYQYI
jgi:hypothetical protein